MQTHTVLPVITMFAAQVNTIHFKTLAIFQQINTTYLQLPPTQHTGFQQPRTRTQHTHYAITTPADVFTNTRSATYDLGIEHASSFELLER
jgi:hypothetical protein